jgi:RNA polymerase sigma-70 factor (ECF subfamily)
VYGRDKVARLLQGRTASGAGLGVVAMRRVEINGQPGPVFLDAEGLPLVAVSLDSADDQVQTLHAVSNPEKLRHLRDACRVRCDARRLRSRRSR